MKWVGLAVGLSSVALGMCLLLVNFYRYYSPRRRQANKIKIDLDKNVINQNSNSEMNDEGIIGPVRIRKVDQSVKPKAAKTRSASLKSTLSTSTSTGNSIKINSSSTVVTTASTAQARKSNKPIENLRTLYVVAKRNEFFNGHNVLQTLSSNGLQFGAMNIFHYHTQLNTNSNLNDAIFSVASATEPGTFNLETIGGYQCKGLCLFMKENNMNSHERYETMYAIASQIREDLDGILLDHKRQPIL